MVSLSTIIMTAVPNMWIVLVVFTSLTLARPMDTVITATDTDSAVAAHSHSGTVPQSDHVCKRHLKREIERCLVKFEQKLILYRAEDTTDYERKSMLAEFCHEYEETLQCLHVVLLQCPPNPEHLSLIEHRLGYLRTFMDNECHVPLEAMTPPPTRKSTTTLPPTTPTTRPSSTSKLIEAITKSTTRGPTTRPPRRTTTFNMAYFSTKVDKLVGHASSTSSKPGRDTSMSTPRQAVSVDIIGDKGKNDIPIDVVEQSKDNGVVDSNMIRVSSMIDCTTPDGKIDVRCAGLPTSSATHVNIGSSIFITVILALCLWMH